jgi:hypothetical protein
MRKCYVFGMEVCAKALKHVFNHSKMKKSIFLGHDSGGLEVCANASK